MTTRLLDPTDPLMQLAIPPGVYSSAYLPTLAAGATKPTFDTATMFDVSAWDAWAIYAEMFTAGTPALLVLSYYASANNPVAQGNFVQQTIQLPPTGGGPFLILGRTLGPLLGVQLSGTLGGVPSNFALFVSNRTRLYDAPYTPVALGAVLANVGEQSIGAGAAQTVNLPYYLGPAVLGGYFGAAASNLAVALVRDNQTPATMLGSIDASSPTTELWIPSNPLPGAAFWELEVANSTAGPLTLAATLTAA